MQGKVDVEDSRQSLGTTPDSASSIPPPSRTLRRHLPISSVGLHAVPLTSSTDTLRSGNEYTKAPSSSAVMVLASVLTAVLPAALAAFPSGAVKTVSVAVAPAFTPANATFIGTVSGLSYTAAFRMREPAAPVPAT